MLRTRSRNLRRWVLDQALPLWGGIGFDSARGAFVERLTFEGAPLLSAPRRAMVQGRQIYVFSHAAMLGWWPEGETIALEAAHRLIDRYHGADGAPGWVFAVHPDGAICDPKRDFYAHAFALFGLAWAYKLAPEPRFLSTALATLRCPRSALRGAHRRLPQRFAGRRRPARAKPAHASLRGHACMVRSHRPRDISCPGGRDL